LGTGEFIESWRKTRDLKIGSKKYKSRISRKWLIAAVGANPEELSLNHTHGRSSAQQHAAQTAGVKTNFMS
jgi:hypothetical protein